MTKQAKMKSPKPATFYRDSAFRVNPAQRALYGGNTATVFMVRLAASDLPFRVEAFGKMPADRKECAKMFVERLMLELELATASADRKAQIELRSVEICSCIMRRGGARKAR